MKSKDNSGLLLAGALLACTALGFVLGVAFVNTKKERLVINEKGELVKEEAEDEKTN